jgi:1-acyl-sn-glycerol-3-phosphate acyltransferase
LRWPEARKGLAASFEKAADDKRIVLIYPEGHLTKVGENKRIRAGVWHMQETPQWPVVPVATSLGLRWQEQDFGKYPGPALIEFLNPIPPGLGKHEIIARLGQVIRTNTSRLIKEGSAWDVAKAVRRRASKPSSVV